MTESNVGAMMELTGRSFEVIEDALRQIKIWDAGEVSEMAAKDEISAAWQRIMRLINEQNEKK